MYLKGFKMLGYIISDKYKINIEEHEIQSFDILHKTDLNIFVVENNEVLYQNDIIKNACIFGHVQILEWYKNSGYEFRHNEWIIYYAGYRHNKIVNWYKNYGYEFKYNKYVINVASVNGHIQVLEWFKNSGYEFKYDKWAFNHKNIKILEWFKNRNVKKVIKWSYHKFKKTIKYKTKNNYIKGYNKN